MKVGAITNIKIDYDLQKILIQLKSILPAIAAFYFPVLLFLGILAAIVLNTNIPMYYFMRDPIQTLNVPSFVGLSSNLGAFLWCSCVAICIYSFVILRRRRENKKASWFFLFAGLLTAIVMFDDFFVIHEHINIHLEGVLAYALYGIPLLYVIPLIAMMFLYIKIILNTDYLILALAILFFGLSLLVDLIKDLGLISFDDGLRILMEDGFKLLGITGWLAYFSRAGIKYMSFNRD